jgi:hypothetical protein
MDSIPNLSEERNTFLTEPTFGQVENLVYWASHCETGELSTPAELRDAILRAGLSSFVTEKLGPCF